jgi:hypothetical protein
VGAASATEAAAASQTQTPSAVVTAPSAVVTVSLAEEANVVEAAVQVRYNIEHDL